MDNNSESLHVVRGVLLIVFVTLGLVGNTAMIIVFTRVEHRTKTISYLMINHSISNIIICAFGFPVAAIYNLKDLKAVLEDPFCCTWLALINCTTGMVSILTLTLTSVVQYRVISKMAVPSNRQNRMNTWHIGAQIAAVWITAIALSIPPMFGWNRFVLVQSGFSCHPDWASQDLTDKAYIWFLVTGGFFIPLTVIFISYGLIYRFMQRSSVGEIQGEARNMRVTQQKKLNWMIIILILAFILSWSPYCFVSLISNFTGRHVTMPGVSIVPELMAKSSVLYSPMIEMYFTRSYRATLLRLLRALSTFFVTIFCYRRRIGLPKPAATTFNLLEEHNKPSFYLTKLPNLTLAVTAFPIQPETVSDTENTSQLSLNTNI